VFEYLLGAVRLPCAPRTSRLPPTCRPTVEGLDDRTAPSALDLGLHPFARLRLAAIHRHQHQRRHHRPLATPAAVFIPSPAPAAQTAPVAPVAAAPAPTLLPPSPTLNSGIQGQVLLEPDNRPLAGATITFSRVNSWIPAKGVQSDANGNFSIALPPGDYIVSGLPLQPGPTSPRPVPQTVHVIADTFTTAQVIYQPPIA
jgi:hypothetical protein